jgi:hypothetical protein
VLVQSGRREEGRDLQRRALGARLRIGKPSMRAAAHNNLALGRESPGQLQGRRGAVTRAPRYLARLAHDREHRPRDAQPGRGLHAHGRPRRPRWSAIVRRSEVLLKVGDRNLIALNLMSTGDALVRLGQAGRGPRSARTGLRMAERDGHMLPALDAHIVLAQAALAPRRAGGRGAPPGHRDRRRARSITSPTCWPTRWSRAPASSPRWPLARSREPWRGPRTSRGFRRRRCRCVATRSSCLIRTRTAKPVNARRASSMRSRPMPGS